MHGTRIILIPATKRLIKFPVRFREYLAKIGKPLFTFEMIESFIGSMPQRIAALKRCFDERQLDELRRLAHHLKASGHRHNFPSLGIAATKLEEAIGTGVDLTGVLSALKLLVELCDRVAAEHE